MKKVLWALAIIIIPAFIFWGAGGLSKKRFPYKYIGVIEGKKISVDEFVKSVEDVQIGLFLNYFNQPEALDKFQKDRLLLNRLAWENLMIKKSARNKIAVSDKEVVDFVTKHPLFARSGIFDNKLYNYILSNSLKMSPRTFEESVRSFLLTTKYKNDIIKNATASDEEVLRLYKNEFEKARLSYVIIDKNDFKENTEVSEGDITAFYEKNKGLFKEPEKAVLQYIAFPHKEEPAREKALEELERAYEKLKRRPGDMEKLCKKLNLPIKETPPFSRHEVVRGVEGISDIGAISFKLRPLRDILPLLSENETGTSYIIRVKERIPPRIKTKDEVSSYIINMVRDEKSVTLAKDRADKLYEEAKRDNLTLKEIAKNHDLELKRTGRISRFEYIEGAGESNQIVTNAFELKIGELSKPITARKGFVLIEPVEFLTIDEEKFEKEKEAYRNKVLSMKKMEALENWFEKMKADSSLNVDLDAI